MTDDIDSTLEIRRILLLTRLRSTPHGVTLGQLVRDLKKVPGWGAAEKKTMKMVLLVVQSLIDDGLVAVTERFVLTAKGQVYLEDPLKWRIDSRTNEEMKQRAMFWNTIYSTVYDTVDKVVHRIRSGNIRPPRS